MSYLDLLRERFPDREIREISEISTEDDPTLGPLGPVRYIRGPAETWCSGCQKLEASDVRVLHCGVCDVIEEAV